MMVPHAVTDAAAEVLAEVARWEAGHPSVMGWRRLRAAADTLAAHAARKLAQGRPELRLLDSTEADHAAG